MPAIDTDFGQVSLLLPFNGANGSTTFTDKSNSVFSASVFGDAQISTAQSKWGGASAYFDGTGDYITFPSNTAFDWSGDTTVECWIRLSSHDPGGGSNARMLWGTTSSNSDGKSGVGVQPDGTIFLSKVGVTGISSATGVIALNTWYFVQFIKTGSTGIIRVNGVQVASGASSNGWSTGIEPLNIGRNYQTGSGSNWHGYVDDFRVTKDLARPNVVPNGAFPDTAPTFDLNFPSVSLLLPFNGTNGSTTITDASGNALSATVNGNAQISTAQAKWGGASALFDGTGDSITYASNGLFDWNSDTTIEAWIRLSSFGTGSRHMFGTTSANSDQKTSCYVTTTGQICIGKVGLAEIASATSTIAINTWYFVQFVKTGSTALIRVNGVQVASGAASNCWSTGTDPFSIGRTWQSSVDKDWDGHIDDLRITKGVARPNVVPIAAFLATGPTFDPEFDKVSLLLPFAGTNGSTAFTDKSNNNFVITANGDAQISTAQSKWGGTSALFDGTGDFLTTPVNSAFEFGTGDFAVELWVRLSSVGSSIGFVSLGVGANGTDRCGWALFWETGTNYLSWYKYNGTVEVRYDRVWNPVINTQYHLKVTRKGTELRIFVDNVQLGATVTSSDTYNRVNTDPLYIGRFIGASNYTVNGYIDDLRITKGSTRATNVPLAAFPLEGPRDPYFSNVSLLLACNGANGSTSFPDTSLNTFTVTANSTAQISTAQSKWGGASGLLNGTSDSLSVPFNQDFSFGTGDFTVEGWFYFNNLSTTMRPLIMLGDGANGSGPIHNAWNLCYMGSEGSNQLQFDRYDGAFFSATTSGLTLVVSTWYYIKVAVASGILRIIVDGVTYYSGSTGGQTFANINTDPLRIGLGYFGPGAGYTNPRYWDGYFDNIRITKGLSRSDIVPTGPFPLAEADPSVVATGGTVTTDGPYTVHTFTSSGTFTVTTGGGAEYLIVPGGGGGGWSRGGGGGGGVPKADTFTLEPGTYPITVGPGGAGGTSGVGTKGGDSVFDRVTAEGGGFGGSGGSASGGNGSSGGGGCSGGSPGTGNPGGNGGTGAPSGNFGGGGGGGAGGGGTNGVTSPTPTLAAGGAGITSSISGTATTYGAGGKGGDNAFVDAAGANGAANTGNGGDGGRNLTVGGNGGTGGSGVVIFRYLTVGGGGAPSSTALVSRALLVGRTSLYNGYTHEIPLVSRNLLLARVDLGRIVARSYGLNSRSLILSRVTLGGRFTARSIPLNSRNLVISRVSLGGILAGTSVFPNLVPSRLQFTPPSDFTTQHTSYSGEVEFHLWADTPTNAQLQLEYSNISDAYAEEFFASWDNAYGIVKRLQLPAGLLNGFDSNLTAYVMGTGINTTWHFTEPPKWTHSIPGYGTLQVNLNSRFPLLSTSVGGNVPFMPSPAIAESVTSFNACDYVTNTNADQSGATVRTPIGTGVCNYPAPVRPYGFRGWVTPSTRFIYARFRDWDSPLFGVGTLGEGPGYRVDGSFAMMALDDNVFVITETTGSFITYPNYTVGTVKSISGQQVGFSPVITNTLAWGGSSPFPMMLSNSPIGANDTFA